VGSEMCIRDSLWMAPFLLHRLGQHDFGVWIVGFQILSYLILLDFGVIAMKVARCVHDLDDPKRPMPERATLMNALVPGDMPLPVKAYRFMLKNPHLSAVISCMVNDQMVKENLALVRAA